MLSLHKTKRLVFSAAIASTVLVPVAAFIINKISIMPPIFADTVDKEEEGVSDYTVTFSANGGTGGDQTLTCTPNTSGSCIVNTANLPSVPTRDGYYLMGWAKTTNATEPEYDVSDLVTITSSTTIYAVWKQQVTIVLTLNTNGGSPERAPGQTCVTYEGGTCSWNVNMFTDTTYPVSRPGYTRLGWSSNQNATTPEYVLGDTVTFSSNLTLYMVWESNSSSEDTYTYTLSYNANGGTGAPSSTGTSATTATSHTFTVSSTIPTRDGYTFLGWASSSTATTAEYTGGDKITLYASGNTSKTLYAVWEEDESEAEYTYTITFNANSGTGAPATLSYGPTSSTSHIFTLPSAKPTRTDYTFKGWATSATATTAAYQPGGTVTVSSSNTARILYAVWEEDEPEAEYTYTISFGDDTDEGVTNLPEDLTYGPTTDGTHTFTLPTDEPTKDGYTFKGWATTKDATEPEYNVDDTITINANDTSKKLYPVWEANDDSSNDDGDNADTDGTDTDNTVTTPDTGKNTESNDGTTSIFLAAPIAAIVLGAGLYTAQRKKSHRIYE